MITRIETDNILEAMQIAGHDFLVQKVNLSTISFSDSLNKIDVPEHVGIVRTNDSKYLGTVGKGWIPIQPLVLYDLARQLIESYNGARITGAFTMSGGSVIGIEINLGTREYVNNDISELNFLMVTSFNGKYGIAGHATMKRLDSMINTSNKVYNLRHTKYVENRLDIVKNILKYYEKEIHEFDNKMNGLVTKRMTLTEAVDWFIGLFPKTKTKIGATKLQKQIDKFIHCWNSNIIPGVKGTSYCAFQALSEFVNHHKTVNIHKGRDEDEVRFESIHFGSSNSLVQRGLDSLTEDMLMTEFTDDDFLFS